MLYEPGTSPLLSRHGPKSRYETYHCLVRIAFPRVAEGQVETDVVEATLRRQVDAIAVGYLVDAQVPLANHAGVVT